MKPKLRATTPEEKKLHADNLNELLRKKTLIEQGHKEGLLSKSQMKKGLAENFNQRNDYMSENKLWVIGNSVFVWEVSE